MKQLLFISILSLITIVHAKAQSDNPFLKLKYDKIVMYDFEGGKEGQNLLIVDKNGNLAKTVSKQVVLNTEESKRLSSKLGSKSSYGDGTASCFIPHLGFVYYLNNKVVAHITICMDCNRLSSSIDIPAQKQGLVGKGKEAYYLREGLSKSFKSYLNGLLQANKFSHQLRS